VPPSEEASASGGGGRNDVYRFPSTGYRLGDHVESGQRIGGQTSATNSGAAAAAQRPEIDIRLLMWENGFSIEDGPLRTFADPANQEFLRTIMSGKVPAELVRGNPGKVVNLRMERRSEPYKAPKSKPFSGTGCRLGDVVPNVVGAGRMKPEAAAAAAVGNSISPLEEKPVDSSTAAQSEVTLKEGEPVFQVQIRLPDGQRLVARFNASHTVTDIRSFVVSARPDLAFAPFQLLTTFPNRVIVDENANLKTAGLMNAVVVVKPTTG